MFNLFKWLFKKQAKPMHGPNTLAELIQQFDAPPKQKTAEEVIRDYQMKEVMAQLQLSYLQTDPAICYQGNQRWHDAAGNKYFDFVPCVLRPEVLYCNCSKS
jgi:hypothetical protein